MKRNTAILFLLLWSGSVLSVSAQDAETGPAVPVDSLPHAIGHADAPATARSEQGPIDACIGSCVGSCVEWGCNVVTDAALRGVWAYHRHQVENKVIVERTVSLDVMAQGGWDPSGGYAILPRARGTFGLFSTDLRLAWSLTQQPGFWQSYSTVDWQILVLNLVNEEPVNFRFGNGMMYFQPMARWIYETSLALDLYFLEQAVFLQTEGRFGSNFSSDIPQRWELSGGINVRFLYGDNLWGYATLGGMYQEYQAAPQHFIFGGLRFNLH